VHDDIVVIVYRTSRVHDDIIVIAASTMMSSCTLAELWHV